jgi:hypothetical protein
VTPEIPPVEIARDFHHGALDRANSIPALHLWRSGCFANASTIARLVRLRA